MPPIMPYAGDGLPCVVPLVGAFLGSGNCRQFRRPTHPDTETVASCADWLRPPRRAARSGQRRDDPRGTGPAEVTLEPPAGRHERVEVDAGLDAEPLKQPDEVLGGEVARR